MFSSQRDFLKEKVLKKCDKCGGKEDVKKYYIIGGRKKDINPNFDFNPKLCINCRINIFNHIKEFLESDTGIWKPIIEN